MRRAERETKRNVVIGDALADAAAHLKGRQFTDEEKALADRVFARFGRARPSDDVAECAAELLRLMTS